MLVLCLYKFIYTCRNLSWDALISTHVLCKCIELNEAWDTFNGFDVENNECYKLQGTTYQYNKFEIIINNLFETASAQYHKIKAHQKHCSPFEMHNLLLSPSILRQLFLVLAELINTLHRLPMFSNFSEQKNYPYSC